MSEKSASEQIDDIIRLHGGWKGEILTRIRTAIISSNDNLVEEVKWKMATRPEGLPVWSHNGMVCFAEIWKDNVKPDGGDIKVNGFDVQQDKNEVKASIGLTGQFAAVDEYLTGEENLVMIGKLYRLDKKYIKARTEELLQQFDLVEAAKRPVKTYSGGMKRRIDLAMSLIAHPPVIFLDEPTTGLDPRSRLTMWSIIKDLASSGVTILLTTQYMDEADQLADNVIVIDGGKVIAEGTPAALKAKVGSDRMELTISRKSPMEDAIAAVSSEKVNIDNENRVLSVTTRQGVTKLKQILEKLENANVEVESVSLHRPTLDDVFLSLTGHKAVTKKKDSKKKKRGKKNG